MRSATFSPLILVLLFPACAPVSVPSPPAETPARHTIPEPSPKPEARLPKAALETTAVVTTQTAPVTGAGAPRSDLVWSNGNWSWAPTSLAWNCWTNALACSNGVQGNFKDMFTTDAPIPTIRRNPNFWFRRFKGWPAISVWNSADRNAWPTNTGATHQRGGVLVTPEHVLTAGHMGFDTNHWLAFMDMNNQVVLRRIVDFFFKKPWDAGPNYRNNLTTNLPSPPWSEYYIGLLDQPVPDNIGFVRIVPTNWLAHFDGPFLNTSRGRPEHPVPLHLCYCQHRTPELQDLTFLQCDSTNRYVYFNTRTLTQWRDHEFWQGGDSGSPWFFVLEGELCLVRINASNIIFEGGRGLSDPTYQQACINAALRELSLRNRRSRIYTLTMKDLSKFPTYGRSYSCSP